MLPLQSTFINLEHFIGCVQVRSGSWQPFFAPLLALSTPMAFFLPRSAAELREVNGQWHHTRPGHLQEEGIKFAEFTKQTHTCQNSPNLLSSTAGDFKKCTSNTTTPNGAIPIPAVAPSGFDVYAHILK
jgi:hypothetical protein